MALLTVTSDALSQTASHIPLLSHFKYDNELYMLIPICAQLHYAKINGPKYIFFAYEDPPYANFSCAKCVQYPYANPHMHIMRIKILSNTPKMNFLRIWATATAVAPAMATATATTATAAVSATTATTATTKTAVAATAKVTGTHNNQKV